MKPKSDPIKREGPKVSKGEASLTGDLDLYEHIVKLLQRKLACVMESGVQWFLSITHWETGLNSGLSHWGVCGCRTFVGWRSLDVVTLMIPTSNKPRCLQVQLQVKCLQRNTVYLSLPVCVSVGSVQTERQQHVCSRLQSQQVSPQHMNMSKAGLFHTEWRTHLCSNWARSVTTSVSSYSVKPLKPSFYLHYPFHFNSWRQKRRLISWIVTYSDGYRKPVLVLVSVSQKPGSCLHDT